MGEAMEWVERSRLARGLDPRDQHQLLTAVTKDIAAARRGDPAARRRVAAYDRAQRARQGPPNAGARGAAEHDEPSATAERG